VGTTCVDPISRPSSVATYSLQTSTNLLFELAFEALVAIAQLQAVALDAVNPSLLGLLLSETSVQSPSPVHALTTATQPQAITSPEHSPPFMGSANISLTLDYSASLQGRLGDPTVEQRGGFGGLFQPQSQFDVFSFRAGDDE